jgi:hypothetical protein
MFNDLKKRPEVVVICAIFAYILLTTAFAPQAILSSLVLIGICLIQNTFFSLASRSRNRSNKAYHALASVFSNGVWFLTMAYMITELDFEFWVVVPYVLGTVLGSLVGVSLSMKIEEFFNLGSDDHLKRERVLTMSDLMEIHRLIARETIANRTYVREAIKTFSERNANGLVERDARGRFKKVSG